MSRGEFMLHAKRQATWRWLTNGSVQPLWINQKWFNRRYTLVPNYGRRYGWTLVRRSKLKGDGGGDE